MRAIYGISSNLRSHRKIFFVAWLMSWNDGHNFPRKRLLPFDGISSVSGLFASLKLKYSASVQGGMMQR